MRERKSARISSPSSIPSSRELACTVSLPVDTLSLVTTRRFEDVETCVRQRQIDLIIAGHHNRLLGVLSSHSLEYINHLTVDVLIKHLP